MNTNNSVDKLCDLGHSAVQGRPRRWRWRRWAWGAAALVIVAGGAWGVVSRAPRYWKEKCATAQKEQRWEDLEVTARQWTTWQTHADDAWLYLADAVQHQHRFFEAADLLQRVPNDSPKRIPALAARIRILCGPAGRPLEGEIACRELLKIEPRATLAHQSLIQFYGLTLQRVKLREQVREAIRQQREAPEAYVYYFLADTMRLASGPSMNNRWLATNPEEELFLVARVLHGDGDTLAKYDALPESDRDAAVRSEKERAARELLPRVPGNINLLAYLIDLEITRGRETEVLELLKQVPAEAESEGRFWRFKGWVHYVHGELDEAEADYRHALRLTPMDWYSLTRLSEVLRAQERMENVPRLQQLVRQAEAIRDRIHDAHSPERIPEDILRDIGRFARESGDELIAVGIERRLGSQRSVDEVHTSAGAPRSGAGIESRESPEPGA